MPVLMDELQLVGEQLGVQREGEVFVIDPKNGFKVAYHGPLDDRFAKARPEPESRREGRLRRQGDRRRARRQAVANPRVDVKVGKTIAFPERGKAAEHRQHLLLEGHRADPPGQVRHLPPEGRHRPLRDGLATRWSRASPR